MKGRQMSDNIMKIMEVMEKCEIEQENAILICFDFYKAFDTVEWPSFFKVF